MMNMKGFYSAFTNRVLTITMEKLQELAADVRFKRVVDVWPSISSVHPDNRGRVFYLNRDGWLRTDGWSMVIKPSDQDDNVRNFKKIYMSKGQVYATIYRDFLSGDANSESMVGKQFVLPSQDKDNLELYEFLARDDDGNQYFYGVLIDDGYCAMQEYMLEYMSADVGVTEILVRPYNQQNEQFQAQIS